MKETDAERATETERETETDPIEEEELVQEAQVAETFPRLDSALPQIFPDSIGSRNAAQKRIEDGRVTVNGAPGRASMRLQPGDVVRLIVPPPEPSPATPENIPLDVVYEDADIIVINKPRGMVVHPAAGNRHGTLVNALLYHCRDLSSIGGCIRPGIVHRIDKDTTGLLVAAKNDAAHLSLAAQLQDHSMYRHYVAVTEGCIREENGTVDAPIGRSTRDRKKMCVTEHGKPAVTHYTVLGRCVETRTTLISAVLETGRTHQIRVHMAYIHHPVVGDPVYGYANTRGMPGQALHAYRLTLRHPATGEPMCFTAAPPAEFLALLRTCRLPTDVV